MALQNTNNLWALVIAICDAYSLDDFFAAMKMGFASCGA
jgi:hypothetical protein